MYQYQVVVGREGPRLVPTFLRQCRRRRQELLVEGVMEDRLVVTRRRRRVEDG